MKDIPDKSIDMILCDLPYGTTACKWVSVYNSWDSRNININFCQWEYEYFTIEETI